MHALKNNKPAYIIILKEFVLFYYSPKVQILCTYIGDVGTGFFYETIIRVASQKFLLPKLAGKSR
jgi:hypothetical protein